MDEHTFKQEILSGNKNDYVSDDALAFFKSTAEYRVINRSALEKGDVEQTEFISIALPEDADSYSDNELIDRVKEKLTDGSRDIQKYQLRDDGSVPNTIEIWRHGSGYSAFALAEY